MTSQSNPNLQQSNADLVAAMNAVAAAANNTTNAVVATDRTSKQYDTIGNYWVIEDAVFKEGRATNVLHDANPLTRELVIGNPSATAYFKITATKPLDNEAYSDVLDVLGVPVAPGGSATISDPMCRDVFYVVASESSRIDVTRVVEVEQVPQL